MPLISIWNSNPESVSEMSIEQIVATCGNGKLLDNSECSKELREYFSQVSSEKLSEYADHCLTQKFDVGGKVLQDIVNEFGRRLDYKVENGNYQGTQNKIGNDGLWLSPDGHSLVIEVKTTDTYSISVDTIAGYRKSLHENGLLTEKNSMLLVVGRYDTEQLEAQVRGSRYAWDMRLISVASLYELVKLKESTEDKETSNKIRNILIPMEYTRLDRLIDVMFTAAQDVEASLAVEEPRQEAPLIETGPKGIWVFTDQETLDSVRHRILRTLEALGNTKLVRKSPSLYWSSDRSYGIACTISKRYEKKDLDYWYAYHDHWDEFLSDVSNGLFVLGCVDLDIAFAIPYSVIHSKLPALNTTERRGRNYWHIKIRRESDGKYYLLSPVSGVHSDLTDFQVSLKAASIDQ
jgi:hypothetical protein